MTTKKTSILVTKKKKNNLSVIEIDDIYEYKEEYKTWLKSELHAIESSLSLLYMSDIKLTYTEVKFNDVYSRRIVLRIN